MHGIFKSELLLVNSHGVLNIELVGSTAAVMIVLVSLSVCGKSALVLAFTHRPSSDCLDAFARQSLVELQQGMLDRKEK